MMAESSEHAYARGASVRLHMQWCHSLLPLAFRHSRECETGLPRAVGSTLLAYTSALLTCRRSDRRGNNSPAHLQ
jgi:hypothetical protein